MKPRPLICSACNKRLDPNMQTIVYFGWGTRRDGKLGPAMVLALCSTSQEQLDAKLVSPCVTTAVKVLSAANITPTPVTYHDWLDASVPRSVEAREDLPLLSQKLLFNE